MSFMRLLIVVLAVMLLAAGCSDKKEQAQQLEDHMLNQEPAQDTTADTVQVPATASDTEDQADAGAVPQEEEMSQESSLPSAPAGNGFTVQVAGCEDRDYAEYLIDLYRGRGYDPFITQATIDGQRYYRVRIGNFDTFQEAQAMQRDLKNRFSVSGWIDRIGS